jgi:hypothetical protein
VRETLLHVGSKSLLIRPLWFLPSFLLRFDVCVGDKGPNALKPITTITGKDASLGSVHR